MIDVWCLLDHVAGTHGPQAPHALDAAERARAARFVCPRSAATYRAAHALKRRVLSHYRPEVAPADWRFETNAWGKPAVSAPGLAAMPHFNLSHSGDAIALAVSDADIGVDIEGLRPLRNADGLARHVLHPRELAWLDAQPARLPAFFRLWTLKEALLKAAGTGFSHPARELAWQGLDAPWATADFAGRTWLGATRAIDALTILAIAAPACQALPRARLLRLPATAGELAPQASTFLA
jgi:phosphopantetheinyl transferase